jgi:hypothetical protein
MYIPLWIIIIGAIAYFLWVKNNKEKSRKMVLVPKEWLSGVVDKTNELIECDPEDKPLISVKVANLADKVKEMEELSTIKTKKVKFYGRWKILN